MLLSAAAERSRSASMHYKSMRRVQHAYVEFLSVKSTERENGYQAHIPDRHCQKMFGTQMCHAAASGDRGKGGRKMYAAAAS